MKLRIILLIGIVAVQGNDFSIDHRALRRLQRQAWHSGGIKFADDLVCQSSSALGRRLYFPRHPSLQRNKLSTEAKDEMDHLGSPTFSPILLGVCGRIGRGTAKQRSKGSKARRPTIKVYWNQACRGH